MTVPLNGAPAAIRPFPAATVKPKLGGYACVAVDPLKVLIVAGPGEPDRPGHLDGVAGALSSPPGCAFSIVRYGAVRRVVAGRPVLIGQSGRSVPSRYTFMKCDDGAGRHDQRPTDLERLGQGVVPRRPRVRPRPRSGARRSSPWCRRPVALRPEVREGHVAAVVPVPGADDRLRMTTRSARSTAARLAIGWLNSNMIGMPTP